tara:strand:- start:1651 stop:1848 length:198 start_codon:yes stop_codon:yes gene_type:complete
MRARKLFNHAVIKSAATRCSSTPATVHISIQRAKIKSKKIDLYNAGDEDGTASWLELGVGNVVNK